MKTSFEIDNLKCSGCAGTITKALNSFSGLSNPHVDLETETISFEYPEGFAIQPVKDKLEGLGYPEKGSLTGLKKMGANAMSYVSCAIGKMTTEPEKN
ncbi:MAG TPA: heavy-metal-associated domain-containing protein [Catalimonadaceae bacterium]|nr:heavy-metal-associated domain-containing protein [Catalimonadaceae bacterium]